MLQNNHQPLLLPQHRPTSRKLRCPQRRVDTATQYLRQHLFSPLPSPLSPEKRPGKKTNTEQKNKHVRSTDYSHLGQPHRPSNHNVPARTLPRTPLMSQLHPHPAALVRLLDRKPKHVVGGAVVEGALALQVGEL